MTRTRGKVDEPRIIRVFVPGPPMAQPRPRVAVIAGRARVYSKGTEKGWKGNVKTVLIPHMPANPIAEPVGLDLTFHIPRPKGHYRTNGEVKAAQQSAEPAKKPDIDNLVKAVMDAMNDLGIWNDDAQVVSLVASKEYAERPGVWIELKW